MVPALGVVQLQLAPQSHTIHIGQCKRLFEHLSRSAAEAVSCPSLFSSAMSISWRRTRSSPSATCLSAIRRWSSSMTRWFMMTASKRRVVPADQQRMFLGGGAYGPFGLVRVDHGNPIADHPRWFEAYRGSISLPPQFSDFAAPEFGGPTVARAGSVLRHYLRSDSKAVDPY